MRISLVTASIGRFHSNIQSMHLHIVHTRCNEPEITKSTIKLYRKFNCKKTVAYYDAFSIINSKTATEEIDARWLHSSNWACIFFTSAIAVDRQSAEIAGACRSGSIASDRRSVAVAGHVNVTRYLAFSLLRNSACTFSVRILRVIVFYFFHVRSMCFHILSTRFNDKRQYTIGTLRHH